MTLSRTKEMWGRVCVAHWDQRELELFTAVDSEAARGIDPVSVLNEAKRLNKRLAIDVPDAQIESWVTEAAKRAPKKQAASRKPRASDARRVIGLDQELTAVVDQTIVELARGEIFQRGPRLVDIFRSAEPDGTDVVSANGVPEIRQTPEARVRELANQKCEFTKLIDGEVFRVDPPKDVITTLIERPGWLHIRPLVGVVNSPTFRQDGTILQEPGYDIRSGLYCASAFKTTIKDEPTQDDAKAAVAELLDVVIDFPFADNVARAAYLAALLTIPARHAIDGPTPMFFAEANVFGAGKGMLFDTIGEITIGRAVPKCTAPTQRDEWTKTLSSFGLAGSAVMCLDNVKEALSSEALEGVLTTKVYEARILGSNELAKIPWRTLILATGNNAQFSSDLVRRTVLIRLESPLVRIPEALEQLFRNDLNAHSEST